jgi:hypothetical protein
LARAATVDPDQLQASHLGQRLENFARTIAVLDIGGVHDYTK